MLACIPTEDDTGLEARICGHFGSAPFFTLVDTESREIKVIPNGNTHHAHGTCHPLSQLNGLGIQCVVTGGMGRRAVETMLAAGLVVYRAVGTRVKDVADGLAAGTLPLLDVAHACGGHGHGTPPPGTAGHGGGGRSVP